MLARPSGFDAALAGPHRVAVRVDLLQNGRVVSSVQTGDGRFTAGLPLVSDGSVRASRSSFARASCDLTLAAATLAPLNAASLLNVNGAEVRVWRGLFMPDRRPVLLPLGTFGVSSVDWSVPTAGVHVTGVDRGQRIMADKFVYARAFPPGSAIGRLRLLVWESLRGVYPGISTAQVLDVAPGVQDADLPAQTVDQDRAQHITDIATSLGCEFWIQPLGTGLLRPIPDVSGPADAMLRGGERGELTSITRTVSRDGVYNAIRCIGQSTDGASPDAVAYDLDPGSPTRWTDDGSGFGRTPGRVSKPEFTSNAQCQVAANALIAEYRGAARTISFGAVVNPARQCSDVERVTYPDKSVEQHVIDSLTTPIVLGVQQGESRVIRSGGVS